MRSLIITSVIALMIVTVEPLKAQDKLNHFSIETEPVAYMLNGAGITGAYQHGSWTYSIEAYGELRVPESLHGNEEFSTEVKGLLFQAERFITGRSGFYIGPELGISLIDFTLKSTRQNKTFTGYSVGLRAGYHWDTGMGNLYLSPVAGLGYTLNNKDVEIADKTFERGPLVPWATVGIGWYF